MFEAERKDPNDLVYLDMHEMREPLRNMVESMREQIDRGEFDLVIGDDASGRLPALVLGDFISKVYKQRGEKPPQRMFFAGSGSKDIAPLTEDERIIKENELAGFLAEHKPGQHALVITELIRSTELRSLSPLLNALKQNNIKYDIAALNIDDRAISSAKTKNAKSETKDDDKGARVYVGEVIKDGSLPKIYRAEMSGVYKDPKDKFAKPIKYFWSSPEAMQMFINEARRDVAILSQELLEQYNQKS